MYVLLDSEQQASRLDELLWTFREDSFIPHERWNDSDTDEALAQDDTAGVTAWPMSKVLFGTTERPPAPPELLINLGAPVPEWFAQCPRVAEIVGGDAQQKSEGRKRYRAYREQGVPLRTHEV